MKRYYSNVTVYFDMDGVLNRFEDDINARQNMWKQGYFRNIPALEEVAFYLERLNKKVSSKILTKIIDRPNVSKEKDEWISNILGKKGCRYDDVIYVPYHESKLRYIQNLNHFNILIDDSIVNLDECSLGGVHCIYFGNENEKYPNINTAQEFENVIEKYFKKNIDILKFL